MKRFIAVLCARSGLPAPHSATLGLKDQEKKTFFFRRSRSSGFSICIAITAVALLVGCSSEVANSPTEASPVAESATPSSPPQESSATAGPDDTSPSPTPSSSTLEPEYPYLAIEEIPLKRTREWREDVRLKSIAGFRPFDEGAWGRCNILQALERIFNASAGSTRDPAYPRSINDAETIDGVDYLAGGSSDSLGARFTQVQIREIDFGGPKRASAFLQKIDDAGDACSSLDVSMDRYIASLAGIEDERLIRYAADSSRIGTIDTVDWRYAESWFYKNKTSITEENGKSYGKALALGSAVYLVRVASQYDGLKAKEAERIIDVAVANIIEAN